MKNSLDQQGWKSIGAPSTLHYDGCEVSFILAQCTRENMKKADEIRQFQEILSIFFYKILHILGQKQGNFRTNIGMKH